MESGALDATFFALLSGMLDLLKREPGCNVNRVAGFFEAEVRLHAVIKHLGVLEQGGLVVSQREGSLCCRSAPAANTGP